MEVFEEAERSKSPPGAAMSSYLKACVYSTGVLNYHMLLNTRRICVQVQLPSGQLFAVVKKLGNADFFARRNFLAGTLFHGV